MTAISSNWQDLIDARFAKVFDDRYKQLPDLVGRFYTVVGAGDTPQKDSSRTSQAGAFGDFTEFTGTVTYQDPAQGYDVTITPREYTNGFQITRTAFDDDLTGILESKPKGLSTSYQRTRQKHAASLLNNAFSLDGTWLNHTEGVPLCSNSHTTTSGASTATGFDTLITGGFSAVNIIAARMQMLQVRGDQAERIAVMPDELWVPVELEHLAYEYVESAGQPDSANNNANFLEGKYQVKVWNYLTSAKNWFMTDSTMRKDAAIWFDRVAVEFAMVESFDELIGKWRAYARYGLGWNDWRWITGASVA